jgi:hypothetical protein
MDWKQDEISKEYFLEKLELSEEEINADVLDQFVEEIELNFEPEPE